MPTLDWLNRAAAFTLAARVPYRLLEQVSVHTPSTPAQASSPQPADTTPVQAELVEAPTETVANPIRTDITDNLLIQGDNLEALKALLPFYRGQVKCIFIDPPYNTRSAFEHYDDNLEHAQWLSMMLPRLQLLRELLREDGSIWVTIDDNEGHYLKVLMDEVFGRENFISTVIWENFYGRSGTAAISPAHNYIHCYSPKGDAWKHVRGLLPRSVESASKYKNPDNDPRGSWRLGPIFAAEERHEGLMYTIATPSGRKVAPPRGSHWRMTEPDFWQMFGEGRISFGANGENIPAVKLYLSEVQAGVVPRSIWSHEEAGHTQDAKREVMALFPGDIPFGTPKPEKLIQNILHIATKPNDLVLDSFLGSGTTAAVAHKMGRRWIGIEMGEHAATHCLPRLQKVMDGEQGGISKAVNWTGGGGFRFMKLGAPVFDENGRIHPEVRFATLAAFVWQQETGSALSGGDWPGTPYLGTNYTIESYLSNEDGGYSQVSYIKTPQFAVYLLFNGILGDKRPASGNVLTQAVLDALLALHASTPAPAAPLLVYGEACRLGAERLKQAHVTFKHIPYDVRAR